MEVYPAEGAGGNPSRAELQYNRSPLLAYLAIVTLARLFAILPLRVGLALGRLLAAIAFHVVRVRRDVVQANIAHVFPDESPARRHEIARDAYRQFAMTLVEVLRLSITSRGLEAAVEVEGLDRFRALRDARTPIIFLQPHAGNFDLAAYSFASRGFPHHTVMRPVKNPRVNDFLVRTRERNGVRVHLKGPESFDELLALLRAGDWLGLCPDQNAKARGITVDWLGKPASIFRGPATLHLATGAQIIVVVDERLAEDPCRHRANMTWLPPRAPTGDEAADVLAIMQAVADAMAVEIRRNPGQYFWFHRLWGKAVAAG